MNKAMICCTSIHLPRSKPAEPENTLRRKGKHSACWGK